VVTERPPFDPGPLAGSAPDPLPETLRMAPGKHPSLTQRFRNFTAFQKERLELGRLSVTPVKTGALAGEISQARLHEILASAGIAGEWNAVEPELRALAITDRAGGVNPGDRRAIFHLLRGLRARSVLEVGTHIGASTVHGVAALRLTRGEGPADVSLTTVDISDVNDPVGRPWVKHGSTYAPREMVARMGAETWVSFVTSPSLHFLSTCTQRFDLVFLDGDHAAKTVYREIPAALRVLRPGGVILLHDYFPRAAPLWSNGVVLPGPWLATERLRVEGAPVRILPLGELPWPTKLNSSVTSLALLVGA
jgi:predicted O-methyltransferase YrrM